MQHKEYDQANSNGKGNKSAQYTVIDTLLDIEKHEEANPDAGENKAGEKAKGIDIEFTLLKYTLLNH